MRRKTVVNRTIAFISGIALVMSIIFVIGIFMNVEALTGGRLGAAEANIQSPTHPAVEIKRATTTLDAGDDGAIGPPIAIATADPTSGSAPLIVQFNGAKSTDPDGDSLTYEWDFESDGTLDSTDPSPLYTYQYAGVFYAALTVTDGQGGENTSTVRIDVSNTPPAPVIETPDGTAFAVGDSFLLRGYASDAEDGPLSGTSLTWEVRQYHANNFSSILDLTSGNDIVLNLKSEIDQFSAANNFLEIRLTATDSSGLSATVSHIMFLRADEPAIESSALALSLCVDPGTGQTLPNCFEVWREGNTYHAESTSSSYSGTLKVVVETALDDLNSVGGGEIIFQAGDFDLGSDWFEIKDITDVIFTGQGIDVTILRNNTNASTDTEPFDFTRSDRITIRDLTVSAGGAFRNTSDAIDFDGGDDNLIERVKVISARGRGIIFDGKDSVAASGGTADHNIVRDCIIIGVPADGIQLLASRWNTIENCQITDVGSEGIRITKASSSADQPHKQSTDNIISGHTIDNAGDNGIKITSGDRNLITGNTVMNSSDDEPGDDGILITSSSSIDCDDNIVEFNIATDNQTVKTQEYGLNIVYSICDRTVVRDNNFAGNLKGEIRDNGTGTIYASLDTEPPTQPTDLATASVIVNQVNLTWNDSTDNVAVAAYDIYRDENLLASIGAVTTYQDSNIAGDTTYAYFVKARDSAGNVSDPSNTVIVTTPPAPTTGTFVFNPSADAYVNASSPDKPYGGYTSLRTDASPDVRSYLRFDVQGLGGYVVQATLRVFANSDSRVGYRVNTSSDAWSEADITYNNAPPTGDYVGASGSISGGSWTEVDITTLITGAGQFDFALTSTSNTATSYSSREGENPAQLVVVLQDSPPPPPGPGTFTFDTDGDAYVDEAKPDRNAGNSKSLRVDASPVKRSYLRFFVQDLVGQVVSATLNIYAVNGSGIGYRVYGVDDHSWTESNITYNNAPALAASDVGASGPFAAGSWTTVDVTSLVAGDGELDIALDTTSNTALKLASSEDSSHIPHLIVETVDGAASSVSASSMLFTAEQFDRWRIDHDLDATVATGDSGPQGDPDFDGLSNLDEFANGADPWLADSDGDGLPDLWEVENGLSPTNSAGANGFGGDPDGDALSNMEEYHNNSDPFYSDNPTLIPPEGESRIFLPVITSQ